MKLAMIITMRRIALLSTAWAIVGFAVAPAQAAAEKTIQQTPYQQTLQAPSCYNALYCQINFPATTAQTVIHNVACWSGVSEGAVIQQLSLNFTNLNGSFAVVELPIFQAGPNGPGLTTGSNLQTMLFLDSGIAPNIFFQLDSGSITNLFCTISGWTLEERK